MSQKKKGSKGALNLPPHKMRESLGEVYKSLGLDVSGHNLAGPNKNKEEAPWHCWLKVESCSSNKVHQEHDDYIKLLSNEKSLKKDVLKALLERLPDNSLELLLQRGELNGKERLELISKAKTADEWKSALKTSRSLGELRVLAEGVAPDADVCRDLAKALQNDKRGLVELLLAQEDHAGVQAASRQFIWTPMVPSSSKPDCIKAIVEEGGEFIRLANAVLQLPCPSSTFWTEGLLLGTTKKLYSKLPAGETKEACLEILFGLASNWEGSVSDLLLASEALSF